MFRLMANDDDSEIRAAIEELTTSFSSVRQVIKALRQKLVLQPFILFIY